MILIAPAEPQDAQAILALQNCSVAVVC